MGMELSHLNLLKISRMECVFQSPKELKFEIWRGGKKQFCPKFMRGPFPIQRWKKAQGSSRLFPHKTNHQLAQTLGPTKRLLGQSKKPQLTHK